jgi:hypothetical protein
VETLVVVLAAALQFLIAVAFLVQGVAAYVYGDAAQRAAEAEVVRKASLQRFSLSAA